MAKIKLTKGELKRQRDALRQYRRYLPTLQLKKQQLQMEIVHQISILEEKKGLELTRRTQTARWAGLFSGLTVDIRPWVRPVKVAQDLRNIAGVDIPVFLSADFAPAEYDLFLTPFWLDHAIEELKAIALLRIEISLMEEGVDILRNELRITTQRVNLFEKVKIPESEDTIRRIKIYIGDQMTNAVGRSKIAKRKIEYAEAALDGGLI